MQDYHRLKVWEKAHLLAIEVHGVAGTFPSRGISVVSQLRRSVLSIPANIAEGAAKAGDAEFRRFLRTALGSAVETDYHLLAARDLELLDPRVYEELTNRTGEVRRMLGGLIKKLSTSLHSPAEAASSKTD
jgi:four helix bundle protein